MKLTICITGVIAATIVTMALGQLPFLETLPQTAFTCQSRNYGYYADPEANCQIFHVCHNGLKWSFLCPNQTLFNQRYLVCDYPENVDCTQAENSYNVNDYFGQTERLFLSK